MATIKPHHYESALLCLDTIEETNVAAPLTVGKICPQCGPNKDPLFLDWRYAAVCSALSNLKKLGLGRKELLKWKCLFPVIYPWDNGYDILRQNVNRRQVLFPMMIVMAKTELDLQQAFQKMLEYHIPFSIRSGSHSFESFSNCDGCVIDQSRRTRIKVNRCQRLIMIEPGCTNGPTAAILDKHGLGVASGTCASVGLTGYVLGGGIGYMVRAFGMGCDNLVAAKLLTATGETIIVNKKTNSDLLFGLRGAGQVNFGVVTSAIIKVHPVKHLIIMRLLWPADKLEELVKIWLDWAPFTDNRLTTRLTISNLNNPTPLLVDGLFVGADKKALQKLLEPLLKLEPKSIELIDSTYLDSVRHFTYHEHLSSFFKYKASFVFKQLPEAFYLTIRKYMQSAGPADKFMLHSLGGKMAEVKSDQTAFPYRTALAWCQCNCRWGENADTISSLQDPWESYEIKRVKMDWVRDFYSEIRTAAGDSISGGYINSCDYDLKNGQEEYFAENLPRLLELKRKYDPNKVFDFPQGLARLL